MSKYADTIKITLSAAAGYFLGGIDSSVSLLLLAMLTDYILGLIVAGVFKKSPKTQSGRIETRAGLKGIMRKLCIIILVMLVARMELTLGDTMFCKNTVVMFFTINELLSVLENAGLMGVRYPEQLKNALEVLYKGSGKNC